MGYENTAGLGNLTHYGPRETDAKYGGRTPGDSFIKKLVLTVDYDDLPSDGSLSDLSAKVPANASIISAKMEIITGFTSTSTTTDLTVGLYQADNGGVIDADGLLTAVNADQTAIATAGNIVTGSGALVGATIGVEAGVVVVAPTVADLLTGKARIIVEYLEQGV